VAFGEAGAEIIGQNLGADGDLNPMVAGRKMSAIFGFAIVRNFSECTECLQEDVMVCGQVVFMQPCSDCN
jgi:hypothetical protein